MKYLSIFIYVVTNPRHPRLKNSPVHVESASTSGLLTVESGFDVNRRDALVPISGQHVHVESTSKDGSRSMTPVQGIVEKDFKENGVVSVLGENVQAPSASSDGAGSLTQVESITESAFEENRSQLLVKRTICTTNIFLHLHLVNN